MSLGGKRILVVEDEYLIAADLKRSLADRGAEVVGPVGDLARGLKHHRRLMNECPALASRKRHLDVWNRYGV